MLAEHPMAGDAIRRFARGELCGRERVDILGHLLRGCEVCAAVLRAAVQPRRTGGDPPPDLFSEKGYDQVFERLLRRVYSLEAKIDAEQGEAVGLWQELSKHPPRRQRMLVENQPRFHTSPLCERILEACFERGTHDGEEAIELAEVALAIAERLDSARCGRFLLNDLRARCWAHVAHARRIVDDLSGAEEGFQRAGELAAEGTGDPAVRADVYWRKAVLRGKQGRYCEAFPLINRAAAIYRRAYLHEDLARVLITKGHLLYVVGDPQRGISELEEGLGLARKVADRRLVLAAKHNLAHCLEECSRLAEAEGLLREIRPEYAALGDSLSLLRLRWFEGKVARRKGETEAAEAAFREVRDAFASRGMSFDTALASLDLAAVLLQRGQAAEMRQLAQESVALFQSLKVPRETLAAILLLETAIQQQRLTVVLLHDFAAFLDKARSNPSLRFWPSI